MYSKRIQVISWVAPLSIVTPSDHQKKRQDKTELKPKTRNEQVEESPG